MTDKKEIPARIQLAYDRLPRYWYNVTADMPTQPSPYLIDGQPATLDRLAQMYGYPLARQELMEERYLDIPAGLRELYSHRRPTILCRAYRLEAALGTPAHVYYKMEGSRPFGTAYLPTALAQAWFWRESGAQQVTTELSNPGWACAAVYAAGLLNLKCVICADEPALRRFPTAVVWIRAMGGEIKTVSDPRVAFYGAGDGTGYLSFGLRAFSMLHQTIVGIEARTMLEELDEYPDMVIGADNGGLDFAGIAFPFMQEKLAGRARTQFVLTEASTCPIFSKGIYAYDHDQDGPLLSRGYTLGRPFPFGEGVEYARSSPILSELVYGGYVEPVDIPRTEALDASMLFARTEGVLPSEASALSIGQTIREAAACKEVGAERVLLTTISGMADFDLNDYAAHLDGKEFVEDDRLDVKVAKALANLPKANF